MTRSLPASLTLFITLQSFWPPFRLQNRPIPSLLGDFATGLNTVWNTLILAWLVPCRLSGLNKQPCPCKVLIPLHFTNLMTSTSLADLFPWWSYHLKCTWDGYLSLYPRDKWPDWHRVSAVCKVLLSVYFLLLLLSLLLLLLFFTMVWDIYYAKKSVP